jgi:hypothetical protein
MVRPARREEAGVLRNYPLEVSEYNATLKCRECEVFIGTGHSDALPMRSPDGYDALCRACYQAALRKRRPGWRSVVWSD